MEPAGLVGRVAEADLLAGLVANVAAGRGAVFLVEGEPGIGKTALVAAGVDEARRLGCAVVRGAGDELLGRFPLRVLIDAFEIGQASADGRRRAVAEAFAGGSPGDSVAAAEELVALVERLCAEASHVVALDDLQWVDDVSLAVWVRLADLTEQLPLLLVGSCRPVPHRGEVDAARRVAEQRGHRVTLGPLADREVAQLAGRLAGGAPDERLLEAVDAASGNPLWVGETIDALLRDNAIRQEDGRAVLGSQGYRAPASLSATIAKRLTFLSTPTTQIVRVAALLPAEFSVTDVAVVVGRPPSDLMGAIGEASAAGVLGGMGGRLGFRHPLIRQALSEQVPASVRSELHRDAARALARSGAPVEAVAAQLVAARGPVEAWQIEWLAHNGQALVNESRQVGIGLLEAALASRSAFADDERYWNLAALLADALTRHGRHEAGQTWAQRVLDATSDPDQAAEMRVLLATLGPTWRVDDALAVLRGGLRQPGLSARARARLLARCAPLQLVTDDDGGAEAAANEALALGPGDAWVTAMAMNTLGLISEARGDVEAAAGCFRRLVDTAGDDPECARIRIAGSVNLGLTLEQLDRVGEAYDALRGAQNFAERAGVATLSPAAFGAYVAYSMGRWDEVFADPEARGDASPAISIVLWGANALIAARRDNHREAMAQLARMEGVTIGDAAHRANSALALAARALAAQQDGDLPRALSHLGMLVRAEFAIATDRCRFLPDLVRLALAAHDPDLARAAVTTAEAEAVRRPVPWSRVAAAHCRGLLHGDPAEVLAAVTYHRECGRLPLLGDALQDAAVLLAAGGATEAAQSATREAEQVYIGLGAGWDLRQLAARLRPYGIRLGVRGPRRRPDSGWAALTPTEVTVARLVAEGLSNPDIGVKLLLSRRTVQTHVSHILAKLGARARLEIAHYVTGDAA
jgi:DNA-binding CsgD family transcriptional regulator/tetratricopeptide (TPR) repeat protein